MVDHALFETDLLAELRHGFELGLGRMAEKDRGILFVSHAKDFLDLR